MIALISLYELVFYSNPYAVNKPTHHYQKNTDMLRLTLYILIWFGSMGLAIFSSQNINPVTVKFLSLESIKVPVGMLLICCAGLGAVAMTLIMTFLKSAQSINSNGQTSSVFNSAPNIPKPQSNYQQKNLNNEFIPKKRQSKSGVNNTWDDDWSDDWN